MEMLPLVRPPLCHGSVNEHGVHAVDVPAHPLHSCFVPALFGNATYA